MKRNLLVKLQMVLFLGIMLVNSLSAQEFVDGKLKGTIRLKFKPAVQASLQTLKSSKNGVEIGIRQFDALSKEVSAVKMERVYPYSPKFEEKHKRYGLDLWYELLFDENIDPEEVARKYGNLSEISIAEPVHAVSVIGDAKPSDQTILSEEELPFDDPKLQDQWHYHNDGTKVEGAVPGADINLFEAWKEETGSSDVIIAIIDGGVDIDHPDLENAIWTNDVELNGLEGIDDDGNGYVDDIYGYNFAEKTGEISSHYHGTHVAGTVGATNNNGIGVSGVAGGDGTPGTGVRLMSLQIFTEEGANGGYDKALVYAADMGAVIAQNSWGWDADGKYDQSVLDAIDYFIAEAGMYAGSPMIGGLAVFAAGNLGAEVNIYPAAYEPVISVASVGPDNERAGYSVFSETVDISAPGGNMGENTLGGVLSTYPGGRYTYLEGTSMACPHVSGVAALVVSKFKGDDFTAEELKRHILTSVNDLSPYLTESTQGKMGNGLIDAAMALQSGDPNIKPDQITTLEVNTAQDFANLSWKVPADADDKTAVSYSIYWSPNEFDENSLDFTKTTIYSAFFKNVGDDLNYTINNLSANTSYYFAIKAYDRWGNASGLSPVVNVSTNSGPGIRLGSDLAMNIDVAASTVASDTLMLHNDSIGLLTWEAHIGLSALEADPYALPTAVTYPKPSNVTAKGDVGALDIQVADKVYAPTQPIPFDERLSHNEESITPYRYIGENDINIPNSSATRYRVDNAEGFNLTNFRMYADFDPELGPAVIEIWEGPVLEDANLVTAQNLESAYDTQYGYHRAFEEQTYFPKGTYIWFVVHIPQGNLYPLALTKEGEDDGSDYCMMSFNVGQTWEPLSEVIGDDTYIWANMLESLSSNLGDYITVSPSEGHLAGGDSMKLAIDVDAEFLVDGTYNENIVFNSNDPINRIYKGAITLDIDGHDPIIKTAKTVDFGRIFAGQTKTLNIQVVNEGYAGYKLTPTTHSSSNEALFTTENTVSGDNIPARDQGWVTVTFKPDSAGVYSEQITLDNGTYQHTFTVNGVATNAAKLVLTPAIDTIPGDHAMGDTIADRIVKIENAGDYPLDYKIAKFSPDYEVEGIEKPYNNFGYSYDYTLNNGGGAAVREENGWVNISSTGTSVLEELKGVNWATEVDLGFSFPFRDRFYDKVWINEQGALVFGEDGNQNLDFASGSSIDDRFLKNLDMITATMVYADFTASSQVNILYHKEDGAFRVEYRYVGYSKSTPDFQIVLYANGDFDVLFLKSGLASEGAKIFLVGLIDKDISDVAFAHNSDYPLPLGETTAYGSYFHFYHPGENLVTAATNSHGTLMPGETADVNLSFKAENVLQGEIYQKLLIVSNDIVHPTSTYTVNMNIVSGGEPDITLGKDTIDFGMVYKTAVDSQLVQIINAGTSADSIVDIRFAKGHFSTTKQVPFRIGTRQSIYVPIYINSEVAADLSDTIYITTATGVELKALITGVVQENATISVLQEAGMEFTLPAGEYMDTLLNVSNNGLNKLELAVVPDLWYYQILEEDTAAAASNAEIKDFDYVWAEGNGSGWVEIGESAKNTNLTDKFIKEDFSYVGIKLNNSYRYYGQTFDSLYISMMGYVSFMKPNISNMFTRPVSLPGKDGIPGAIGPMMALHVPNPDAEGNGIFYQEEGNRIIISWNKYIDLTGMSNPYSFQVIINKNGRIDFNYKDFERVKVAAFIGIESPDEEQAAFILGSYVKNGVNRYSYTIFPVEKEVVPSNSTVDIPLRIDATYMTDGTYSGEMTIHNNSVDNNPMLIPMTLHVIGKPELQISQISTDTLWYAEGMEVVEGFTISNVGMKEQNLSHATFTSDNTLKAEFYYPANGNMISGWPEGYVPVQDFIGQQIMGGGFRPVLIADGSILQPGESWQFYLTYTPTEPGASTAEMILYDDNNHPALTVNIGKYSMYPPAATISDTSFSVHAVDSTVVENHELYLSNKMGLSDLNWNATVDFNRGATEVVEDPELMDNSNLVAPLNLAAVSAIHASQSSTLKSVTAEDFNRTLEHSTATSVDNWLGFGPALAFKTATKFVAPDNGFTISHIKTWFRRETVLDGVIYVEIRAGGDRIEKTKVIAEGRFDYSFEESDDVGEFMTIPLDQTGYLYPGEEFYVVISYPLSISNPQGVSTIEKEDRVSGRYFFNYEGTWFDITSQAGADQWAYMVKALEETFTEQNWVSVDQTEGSISAGDSAKLTLTFSSAFAQELKNHATMVINTNDPENEEFKVDLSLLMNEAPVIELTQGMPVVEELQTGSLTFEINDLENDNFSVEYQGDAPFVEVNNTNEVVTINFTPGYSDQGIYDMKLVATDEHGAIRTHHFQIQVLNVNRAPQVAQSVKDTTVILQDGAFKLDFGSIIFDEDNDLMNYSIEHNNHTIAELFTSQNSAIVEPLRQGTTTVTLMGADYYGASVTATFNITVDNLSGIGAHDKATLQVYPNPVNGVLNVVVPNDLNSNFSIRMMNINGSEVYNQVGSSLPGSVQQINMENFSSGIYFVEVISENKSFVNKIVKR